MRKKFYLYILALVLCVGLSSCNKEKEYTCRFKIDYECNHSNDSLHNMAVENEKQELFSACTEVFKADKDRYFTISANNIASLTAQVNDLCNQIETKFNEKEWFGHYTVLVYDETKRNKDRSEMCSKEFGHPMTGTYDNSTYGYSEECLSNPMRTYNYRGETSSQYNMITEVGISNDSYYSQMWSYALDLDLNRRAGGDYIYLRANVSSYYGKREAITHLIILETGQESKSTSYTIEYQGRTYHMATSHNNANLDLNADDNYQNHTHLYLMYTKDRNDGWELHNIRGLYSGSYKEITQYIFNDINDYNEVVPLVKIGKDGKGEREAVMGDCNAGFGGNYIYLQGRYIKRD